MKEENGIILENHRRNIMLDDEYYMKLALE
ncbi:hypothetical protein, partial [Halobacillus trueperi]